MWTSTFALGAFVGPTAAGILLDFCGFPWATMYIVGFGLFFLLVSFALQCHLRRARAKARTGYVEIGDEVEVAESARLLEEDHERRLRRQRRSPSMGYDTGGMNTPAEETSSDDGNSASPNSTGVRKKRAMPLPPPPKITTHEIFSPPPNAQPNLRQRHG